MLSKILRSICVVFLISGAAQAAPITLVGFNGELTNAQGNPATGSHDMSFRVYDSSISGSLLSEDLDVPVTVDAAGRFSTAFNIPASALRGVAQAYLEVEVDGEKLSRMRLTAVPYSILDTLGEVSCAAAGEILTWSGSDWSCGPAPSSGLDISCKAGEILKSTAPGQWGCAADDAGITIVGALPGDPIEVSTPSGLPNARQLSIKANSLGAAHLANEAVNSAELAKGAVQSTHLAAGSVGAAALANGSVGSLALAADAVTATKIATNAVTADAIATSAVTAAAIATNAVGADEIAANAVGSSEIASGAVGTVQLAGASVTPAKMAPALGNLVKACQWRKGQAVIGSAVSACVGSEFVVSGGCGGSNIVESRPYEEGNPGNEIDDGEALHSVNGVNGWLCQSNTGAVAYALCCEVSSSN